jgi:hypothetical protein
VRGKASDLRLGFTAILQTALKAMPSGGFLLISASYFSADGLPERVEVRVEERPSVILAEAPEEAVEPSSPVESTSRDKVVDLADARAALARAGGSLVLEDASEFGLSFLATLQVDKGA